MEKGYQIPASGLGLPHKAELPSAIPLCRHDVVQQTADLWYCSGGLFLPGNLSIKKPLAFLLARLAKTWVGVEIEAAGLIIPGQCEHTSCHRHLGTVSLLLFVPLVLRQYS